MNLLRPVGRDRLGLGALALAALLPPVGLLAWNHFPFVYWDTSEYLYRWVEGRPGFDRPIFYSFWLAAFHPLPYGLYAAALAQASVSILLIVCVGNRIGPYPLRSTALFLLCLSLSPTVFHSVTLMPDAATSWLVFSLALLTLNGRPVPKLALAAATTSILFHNSHFLLFLSLAPVVLVVGALNRRPLARLGRELLLILLVSLAGNSWNSWLAGLGFRSFAPSSLFLAARLQEARLLAPGLREFANIRVNPRLRARYETLAGRLEAGPGSLDWFAWDNSSPLNEQWPGWRNDAKTFRSADQFWSPVVWDTLRREWRAFIQSGFRNAWTMLNRTGSLRDFSPHRTGSGVDRVLERYWGANRERHLRSRQATGELPIDGFPRYAHTWERASKWLAGLSTLALIFASWKLLQGCPLPRSPADSSASP